LFNLARRLREAIRITQSMIAQSGPAKNPPNTGGFFV
jgi:hypothetical protein